VSGLTLTSEQIRDARMTLEWIQRGAPHSGLCPSGFPGYAERTPGSHTFKSLERWADDLRIALAEHAKPAIKLRIRVGVTTSGEWSAVGGSKRVLEAYTYGADISITDDLANVAEEDVVAWHWITAEVPMPEVEQGEVAGEVEHG